MVAKADYSTEYGAGVLAAMIRAYWAERGFAITVRVENANASNHGRHATYGVRSDLVGGLPRVPIKLPMLRRQAA